MRVPRPALHLLGAAGLILLTVGACGAATGGATSGSGASLPPATSPAVSLGPGAVGDCPLPSPPPAATAASGGVTSSVGTATASTAVIGPGTLVTPGADSPTPMASVVPGHPGIVLPSSAPIAAGDVAAVVGSGPQAVALHVGRRLTLVFPPSQAVTVPSDPDPAVLSEGGRTCQADGTAVFGYVALRPGTAVLVLLPGPRCLHSRPACLPAQREEPLRVDVVP